MNSGLVEEDGWSARFETDLADEYVIAVLRRGDDPQVVDAVLERPGCHRKPDELVILIADQLAEALLIEHHPPRHLDVALAQHQRRGGGVLCRLKVQLEPVALGGGGKLAPLAGLPGAQMVELAIECLTDRGGGGQEEDQQRGHRENPVHSSPPSGSPPPSSSSLPAFSSNARMSRKPPMVTTTEMTAKRTRLIPSVQPQKLAQDPIMPSPPPCRFRR